MSDYLLLVREDEAAHASQSPAAIAALIASRARFADELRRAGRLKDHGRFRPSREGKRVRARDDTGSAGPVAGPRAANRIDAPKLGEHVRLDDATFVDDGQGGNRIVGPSHEELTGGDMRVIDAGPFADDDKASRTRGRIDAGPFADDDKAPAIDVQSRTRVRVDDGPFADDDKALAAYYWIDASDVDDAARVAADIPALSSDEIDVRPLMKGAADPDMQAKPGKIFAFAVLGTAESEPAWSEVMDRIDAETHDRFPVDSFLGGNRLQPPRTGRRVATRREQNVATTAARPVAARERRATFDGPFLESKEVIGGVFFLRMMSIDDAVRWAAASRFVVHGALEIRELWRS